MFARKFLAISVLAALLIAAGSAFAQDGDVRATTGRLEQIRAALDRIEATVERSREQPEALLEVRKQAAEFNAELNEIVAALEPVHKAATARVKELGPAPKSDQPPEPLSVAAEREQQAAALRDADAALKQSRLLAVRSGQIVEGIDRERRSAFTTRLFQRGDSFFLPDIWSDAANSLHSEIRAAAGLVTGWRDHLAGVGAANLALGLLLSLAAFAAIALARTWIYRRFSPQRRTGEEAPLIPHSHKAVLAARDALLNAVTAPAAVFAVIEIFSAFGLFSDAIRPLAVTLVGVVAFYAIGHALSLAVLSPDDARRRLPALNDGAAATLHRMIIQMVAITAVVLFLNALHRTLTTSVPLAVATSATHAFLMALVIAAALIANRPAEDREDGALPPWIRLTGWLAVSVILVALAAGYIRFAEFVAERAVTAVIVLNGLVLLLALVSALLGDGLARDSTRRRTVANTLGLRLRTLDLLSVLVAGLLRAVLVLAAILLIVGTLSTTAVDLPSTFRSTAFAMEIGAVRIRLWDVIAAVIVLLAGGLVTRILYRWLSHQVLPRTQLESSLQNSIATIAAYIGVIAAIALALGRLGVNLENIALVAGALSIGIGFGLQSVVSNFVSGLILLTERPIRVGDWIVVGQEQGYVRRISVRSTEIETFDKATVIVPNSDLITGTVKNWTHFNNLGRFSVPVRISSDGDPDAVRDLLLRIAADHPLVLGDPSPNVFFLGFGESYLELELRGFVGDVNQAFGVRSELHFEIFRRFRAAGIAIPYPQRDVHIRSAPDTAAAPEEEPAEKPAPRSRKR